MSDCNHWPGQRRCEVCGMGRTGFERALLHAIEQSRKGHWLNVAATLSEAQQVALRELSGVLKGGSITAVAVAEKSPAVASASPDVAEKSPLPECSICRGRHGLEVTHACE